MITVYGGWPSRSMRVLWLLEEMGLDYELRPVNLRRRVADAEFMALNPAGFLPVLKDGELTMIESVAMMEYLARRYGPTELAPGPQDPTFALYQQFLHFGEASLAAYLNPVVASLFLAPEAEKRNWGVQAAERMFFNRLDLVAKRLEASPHLAGEAFTAADISVHYALEMGGRLGLADRYPPTVSDYMQRLTGREGYRRAEAKSPPRPEALRQ
jgi:glutathione S-transferase